MKRIASVALLLAATLETSAPAQTTMPFLPTTAHDIQSAEGGTYRIIVPPPAGPAPAAGYPVIYIVDGNAWAPMASEIIRTNLDFGTRAKVEPAVVVGIGYPVDGAFDLVRRTIDLTTPSPVPRDSGGYKIGGYENMIRFIQERVKPDIEKRFRIDRTRQTLAGHSLGGLFTLRTLMNHPDFFQTYLALSPSIWWNNAVLLKEAAALTAVSPQRKARVYLGVGQLEQYFTPAFRAEMEVNLRALAISNPAALEGKSVEAYLAEMETSTARMVDNARQMSKILDGKGLEVRFDLFPEEDHFSVLASQFGRAVPFALRKPTGNSGDKP
jgi:predicted alpha/beta superfamily hydrolase